MDLVIKRIAFLALFLTLPLFLMSNHNGDNDECESEVENTCEEQDLKLPKVFLIGEYAEEFDIASSEYKVNLFDACGQDMQRAYYKWQTMLIEMEDYAENMDFDLKGVKMWVKVFWAANGKIDHIAYYLKPRSRNADINDLTAFLIDFTKSYEFPLISENNYSHYGSANFPVVTKRVNNNN